MYRQCLDISQMQHLKELGVDTSKANMYWVRLVRLPNVKNKEKEVLVDWFLDLQKEHMHVGYDEYECLPTFTLQDILDLLPKEILTDEYKGKLCFECVSHGVKWIVSYKELSVVVSYFCNNSLIDAAYEMLCWCIENGYIKTNKEE